MAWSVRCWLTSTSIRSTISCPKRAARWCVTPTIRHPVSKPGGGRSRLGSRYGVGRGKRPAAASRENTHRRCHPAGRFRLPRLSLRAGLSLAAQQGARGFEKPHPRVGPALPWTLAGMFASARSMSCCGGGLNTSNMPIARRFRVSTASCDDACAPCCANGRASQVEVLARGKTMPVGPTATLPSGACSVLRKPMLRPVGLHEEPLTNWRAVCERSTRTVRREGRVPSLSLPLSGR